MSDAEDPAGEEPDVVARADGSLLIDGLMVTDELTERLVFPKLPCEDEDYQTVGA